MPREAFQRLRVAPEPGEGRASSGGRVKVVRCHRASRLLIPGTATGLRGGAEAGSRGVPGAPFRGQPLARRPLGRGKGGGRIVSSVAIGRAHGSPRKPRRGLAAGRWPWYGGRQGLEAPAVVRGLLVGVEALPRAAARLPPLLRARGAADLRPLAGGLRGLPRLGEEPRRRRAGSFVQE